MVLGNHLQGFRDTYNSFARAGAQQPSNPGSHMKRSRPTDEECTDKLSSGNMFNTNMQESSSSRLRTMLSRRDADIQREKHRYRSLEGNFRKAHEDLKQSKLDLKQSKLDLKQSKLDLKQSKLDNAHLRFQLRLDEGRFFSMIRNHMDSFAKRNGFQSMHTTKKSVPALLDELLNSVMQNIEIKKEVKSLQINAQNLQNELHAANVAERDRQYTKDRADELQEQVYTLQQQLLNRVDKECAISDDMFAKDFRCLVALIKSLSRSIKIDKDMNIMEVLGVGGLLIGVNDSHGNTRARKKCLAEAWVWSVLLDRIFASPFALFEGDDSCMTDLWYKLFGEDHHHGWPTPSTLCETWRYTTMERLVSIFGLTASKSSNEQDASVMHEDDLDSLFRDEKTPHCGVRDETIDLISTRLATVSPKGDFKRIPAIVDRAVSLVVEMSLQRCRLQVTYPAVNATFIDTQMSAVADPDDEYIRDGVVAFVVRPGLTKWGDASGKALNHRYDIVQPVVQVQTVEEATYVKLEFD